VETNMTCEAGRYRLPTTVGLGVVPRESLWNYRMDI
jgi:hypothetical protein